jgi:hypothetical protein
LADIAPPEFTAETVVIRGTELKVRGISMRRLALLMARFPNLARQYSTGGLIDQAAMILDGSMVDSIDLVAATIAAGLGSPDPETEELVRERLSEDEQFMVYGIVMKLTNGLVARPLSNGVDAAAPSGVGPDMNSQKSLTS